ncbi:MAG: hypothetical protein LBL96_11755 [Clostridiales bacterium]|nr:hypothetical protein [Clostridiales bacterium]
MVKAKNRIAEKAALLLKIHSPIHSMVWLLMAIYIVEVILTAWVADDGFIAYGTVRNFQNGYGLVFNVGERVQSYTNPLLVFVYIIISWISGEPFYSLLLINITTSLAGVFLLAGKLPQISGVGGG